MTAEHDDEARLLALTGGDYFCANPACVLHVREGDVGVHGRGNWAKLPAGRWASRSRYGELMLCNDCGRDWLAARRAGSAS